VRRGQGKGRGKKSLLPPHSIFLQFSKKIGGRWSEGEQGDHGKDGRGRVWWGEKTRKVKERRKTLV